MAPAAAWAVWAAWTCSSPRAGERLLAPRQKPDTPGSRIRKPRASGAFFLAVRMHKCGVTTLDNPCDAPDAQALVTGGEWAIADLSSIRAGASASRLDKKQESSWTEKHQTGGKRFARSQRRC
jgi:hypothetical protein